ncbi:MAG: nucleotidyltransferase [Frankiales bacterium]|nr:nucleotidyltransferase [Frankiales bacterium]
MDDVAEGQALVDAHCGRIAALGAIPFLHGSLVLGGYHHGISDVDVIFRLDHPLTDDERVLVDAAHEESGPSLAASYVHDPCDPEVPHPTWTHGWSGDRRVSLITRAELHQAHPQVWPEIPDLAGVVALEVKRAWTRELRDPRTWWKTEYVDLALTSCVRALLTQADGQLTSKDSAIGHLEVFGVPERLAVGVALRRQGRVAPPQHRSQRAVQARREVRRLLAML